MVLISPIIGTKLNIANRTDYPGPNIYIAKGNCYTGLHADNNFAVLAVHHNLLGSNRVTLFKASHDLRSAQSLYQEIIKISDHTDTINPKEDIDIFDTFKFPIEVSPSISSIVSLISTTHNDS